MHACAHAHTHTHTSCSLSLSFSLSLIHPPTQPPIAAHSLARSPARPLTHSLVRSRTHSMPHVHDTRTRAQACASRAQACASRTLVYASLIQACACVVDRLCSRYEVEPSPCPSTLGQSTSVQPTGRQRELHIYTGRAAARPSSVSEKLFEAGRILAAEAAQPALAQADQTHAGSFTGGEIVDSNRQQW